MAYLSRAPMGVDLTLTTTTAQYDLGTPYNASNGEYVYVKASGAVAQYALVKISSDGNWTAAEGTTTLLPSTEPAMVGVAQVAIADTSYGWVWRGKGIARCKFAASCVQDVKIYTTATGGVVDDAATTLVNNLKLITTITSATDSPCFAGGLLTTVGA